MSHIPGNDVTVDETSVRNGAVRPGQGQGRTTFRRPVLSFPELARQARAKDQDGRHCVVPHRPTPSPVVPRRPLSSPAVFRCFPLFSAVPCRPPSSPAALCRDLPSHTRRCLTSWGSSSFVMRAVLEVQGRERTAFCRPVRSFSKAARQVGMKDEDGPRFAVPSRPGLLAVPPPGPTGAPDGCEHWSISTQKRYLM